MLLGCIGQPERVKYFKQHRTTHTATELFKIPTGARQIYRNILPIGTTEFRDLSRFQS